MEQDNIIAAAREKVGQLDETSQIKIEEKLDYEPTTTPVPLKCKLGFHKWNPKEYTQYQNKHGWACAPFDVKVCDLCGGGKITHQYPS